MRENDPVCLVCGRRCPGAEVLYVRPNGNTHQAVALCGKRCRRAYNGPREAQEQRGERG